MASPRGLDRTRLILPPNTDQVIIADQIPEAVQYFTGQMPGNFLVSRTFTLLVLAVLVLIPLSSMKSLASLRVMSYVCVVILCCSTGIVVWTGVTRPTVHASNLTSGDLFGSDPAAWMGTFPVVFFCFVAHVNVPMAYQEQAFARGSNLEEQGELEVRVGGGGSV